MVSTCTQLDNALARVLRLCGVQEETFEARVFWLSSNFHPSKIGFGHIFGLNICDCKHTRFDPIRTKFAKFSNVCGCTERTLILAVSCMFSECPCKASGDKTLSTAWEGGSFWLRTPDPPTGTARPDETDEVCQENTSLKQFDFLSREPSSVPSLVFWPLPADSVRPSLARDPQDQLDREERGREKHGSLKAESERRPCVPVTTPPQT